MSSAHRAGAAVKDLVAMTGQSSENDNLQPHAAVIVAHPDDETLWGGGEILDRPAWRWSLFTLCRASDPDRAPRFARALRRFGADGLMGDLDDGPAQTPLAPRETENAIRAFVGNTRYDVIYTHSPFGEYTRHRRHEETAEAVLRLWESGALRARQVCLFAYSDGEHQHLPRAIASAHRIVPLSPGTFEAKRRIVTEIYGFAPDSFEAMTCPREEAFWVFDSHLEAREWRRGRGDAQ